MKLINIFLVQFVIFTFCIIYSCLSTQGCRTLNNNPVHRYLKDNFKVGLKDIVEDLKDMVTTIIEKVDRIEEKISFSNTSLGPKDCDAVQKLGYNQSSVYIIIPNNCANEITAYCDLKTDGGGWLIIQRRLNGKENFYRGWADYKHGFGNPSEEYWLGNDYISLLTSQEKYELRIDLEDFDGKTVYANYKQFIVAPENFKYKLTVGKYSGTAGDSFSMQNGMEFTTRDQDNDIFKGNCAVLYKGAWWYSGCHQSNLNGQYFLGGNHKSIADGINWKLFKGFNYSLKRSEMKIRPLGSL